MSLPTCATTIIATAPNGEPLADAPVQCHLSTTETYDGIVVPQVVAGTTDGTGTLVLDLWPNSLGTQGSRYVVLIGGTLPADPQSVLYAVIPDETSCNLHEHLVSRGESIPITGPVMSVGGATGNVTLADLGLDLVDNTPDALKPISTPVANALAGKADVGSVGGGGLPTGITVAKVSDTVLRFSVVGSDGTVRFVELDVAEAEPPTPPDPLIAMLAAAVAGVTADGGDLYLTLPDLSDLWQDDAGTVAGAIGQLLALVGNRRSAGPDLGQTVALNRPTLVAMSNGRPAIQLVSADHFLQFSDGTGSSGEWIIAGQREVGAPNPAAAIGNRNTGFSTPGVFILAGITGSGQPGVQFRVGSASGAVNVETDAAISGPIVAAARWTPTSATLRVNGGTEVVAAHTHDASSATPVAVGRIRPATAGNNWAGTLALVARSSTAFSSDTRQAIERLGAYLVGGSLAYDAAPTLSSISAYQTSSTRWVDVPYDSDSKAWPEPTFAGATWYPRMDIYLPAGIAPAGGWKKPVIYTHANGATKSIPSGGSVDVKLLQPLLAAGSPVFAVEFPHPALLRAASWAGAMDAYNYIGRAVQRIRSLSAALNIDATKIGAVTRSRGSLALYTALRDDLQATVGTHQQKQSSQIQAFWCVNGQTVHRSQTACELFVIEADWPEYLAANPDYPELLNAVDLVFSAYQVPFMHLVNNDAYTNSPQPWESVGVHHPDMFRVLKERCTAIGYGSKVTDAPSTAGDDEFVGMPAYFAAKLA